MVREFFNLIWKLGLLEFLEWQISCANACTPRYDFLKTVPSFFFYFNTIFRKLTY